MLKTPLVKWGVFIIINDFINNQWKKWLNSYMNYVNVNSGYACQFITRLTVLHNHF